MIANMFYLIKNKRVKNKIVKNIFQVTKLNIYSIWSHSYIVFVNVLELSADDASVSSLNQFPEAVSANLIAMADWLIAQSRDEFMNVYARVRANVLLKSLHQLREQQRSGSGGSVQGVTASPVVVSQFCFLFKYWYCCPMAA